ncbi:NAD(P)H-hydrate dehydratase [Kallipyga massiliensis]|uniref:NAD(P)H-hydrate dehydratase n=1 Tax=Kallipyga massiliensis TaxID=1472764 RepID=UPI0026F26E83|nr:NAD(P)H-hydrate dehydratase [Kallipyga massiliensis]
MMEVGIDLCQISRIEKTMSHPSFLQKILTVEEREALASRLQRPETIAGIYAAKEAVMKVLGTGFGPVGFQDIQIFHSPKGQPRVSLTPKAQQVMDDLRLGEVRVSISHEGDLAMATAVGVEVPVFAMDNSTFALRFDPELNRSFLRRDRAGYKGQYGRLAILGGSTGMAGAVCMAAQAALRSGTGLVYVVVPESISTIVQIKLTEAIVIPVPDEGKGYFTSASLPAILDKQEGWDCLAIGPGMGRAEASLTWFRKLLPSLIRPGVLDADGLFALSRDPDLLDQVKTPLVITPHEMEMARLLGWKVGQVREDRELAARTFSERYGVITLLKGPDTLITDGKHFYTNTTGNPGMATAGSGDVLTGILAGFIAHDYPPILASRLAPYLHGLAGDLAAEGLTMEGMVAGDIIASIPLAFSRIEAWKEKEGDGHAQD